MLQPPAFERGLHARRPTKLPVFFLRELQTQQVTILTEKSYFEETGYRWTAKKAHLSNDNRREKNGPKSTLCHDLLGHLGLHVGGSLNEILHHLVTLFLAGSLDLLQLLLGFLVRVVLGLLETARVLQSKRVSGYSLALTCRYLQKRAIL